MAEGPSLQDQVLGSFHRFLNGQVYSTGMARLLKVNPIAVISALRALERKGLVGRSALNDRWDVHRWYLTRKAKDAP